MIKVLGLYVKRAKGQPPEASDELVLIENMGVRGDVFSVGGDRQVSLMFKKTRDEIDALPKKEACLLKFCCNILLDGGQPSDFSRGTRLKTGETELEISAAGRSCHDVCSLDECPLIEGAIFARVITGGLIRIGDEVIL